MSSALPTSGSGLRKAAVLMVLLGDEAATAVYRRLGRSEVRRLTKQIGELTAISPGEATAVLEDYYQAAVAEQDVVHGGADYANQLLVRAYGEKDAQAMLIEQAELPPAPPATLDGLLAADPKQLASLLGHEHPQTIAVVMAHMSTRAAASLLALLPESTSTDAVKRLAEMRQFSPKVAEKISTVLKQRFDNVSASEEHAYAGVKTVAEILNRTESGTGKKLLDTIEQTDPTLALSIRDMMFTFEDLVSVPETGLREWLAQIDKKTLALALKNVRPELYSHITAAMSSRAAEMLKEDMDALGPVRAKDIQQAQLESVQLARRLEAEGKMTLRAEQNEEFVV